MGMLKRMKDMRDMVEAAHGLAGTAFGIALSTSLISMLR
jgi:hypothetical protein